MKKRLFSPAVLPLLIFSLLFVAGPLIYMVILSFLTPAESWGVIWDFSLKNYADIGEPIYLSTFWESFKLALISVFFVILIGYPFGYFMAKLTSKWKKRTMMLIMIPFWVSSLLRLYGWIIIFRAGGVFDNLLMSLRITSEPLKLLYTYPAVVVGMVYVLLPFMIYSVYSAAEKLDFGLVEAARDLGASPFQAFMSVSFKLTLPGLASGIGLTFVPCMGLFFIADILGGNKVVLVGNLIHDQLMKVRNQPFAAAISVVLLIITAVILAVNRRVSDMYSTEGEDEK